MWQYDAQKLNKSLALRAANELKLEKSAIDTLKATFQMHVSVAKDKVAVPTSNNQIVSSGSIFESLRWQRRRSQ